MPFTVTEDEVSSQPLHRFYAAVVALAVFAFFVYGLIAHVSPTDELHALWQWYNLQPGGPDLRDALLAIASVGAVVWTGGLIALQLRGLFVEIGSALEYLRFSFIAPLFALVGDGAIVRTVALLFIVFYVRRVFVHFRTFRLMAKAIESVAGTNVHFDGMAVEIAQRIFRVQGTTAVASLVACVLVLSYPSKAVVSWSSLLALLGGLQFISSALLNRKLKPTP